MRKGYISRWLSNVPKERVADIPSAKSDKLYCRWLGMMDRCHNPNSKVNSVYKKRGISVADEWQGLDGFFRFREWSIANGYADDLVIDRIDGFGNYSPDNCRWVTKKQNNNNRISPKHIVRTSPENKTAIYYARLAAKKSVMDVAKHMGVSKTTVYWWEQGIYAPRAKNLMRLSEFLGCGIEDLLKIDHTEMFD